MGRGGHPQSLRNPAFGRKGLHANADAGRQVQGVVFVPVNPAARLRLSRVMKAAS